MLVALAAAGCSPASGQSTTPTLGSAEPTAEDLESVAVSGPDSGATDGEVAGEGPDEREPVGPPLSPGSSAEQILEVVSDIHGPTSDVAAQMNRLVRFPDIPTPPDAELSELGADVRERSDGATLTISSEVGLTSSATIEEVAGFYEAAFAERGWRAVFRSSRGWGPGRVEHLAYQIPGTAYEQNDVEVSIAWATSDTQDGVEVRIRFVEVADIDGGSPRRRFDGWIGDLPLPDEGVISGAGIQTSDLDRQSLHFHLTARYDGQTPIALGEQIRATLPADDYTIAAQPPMGAILDNWVYLNHPFFDDVRISPHRVGTEEDPLATTVNIDARVGFSPRH